MSTFESQDHSGSQNQSESHTSQKTKGASWDHLSFKNMPIEALLASHRRNMDTMRHVQQTATELVKELVTLNNQYVRHSFDDMCHYTRTLTGQMGTSKMEANAKGVVEGLKSSFDRSMSHCKKVGDLFTQSSSKVFESYKARFEEGLKEAQDMASKAKK